MPTHSEAFLGHTFFDYSSDSVLQFDFFSTFFLSQDTFKL